MGLLLSLPPWSNSGTWGVWKRSKSIIYHPFNGIPIPGSTVRLAFLFSPTWRQDVEFKFGSCKSYSRCGFNSNLQKPLPITSSTRNGWYILRAIPNQKGLWQRYFDTSIPNAVWLAMVVVVVGCWLFVVCCCCCWELSPCYRLMGILGI